MSAEVDMELVILIQRRRREACRVDGDKVEVGGRRSGADAAVLASLALNLALL